MTALNAGVALIDRLLAALAGVAMVAAFACVALGVLARALGWDLPGLDAYAGYAIAAALFLAVPQTLRLQGHIRVTLLLEHVSERWRGVLQWWALSAGVALSVYLAWFSVHLVWVSRMLNDVSQASDATPLWIPQLAMAVGCCGLALTMVTAWFARLFDLPYFVEIESEFGHAE